jgi:hypothetical protein
MSTQEDHDDMEEISDQMRVEVDRQASVLIAAAVNGIDRLTATMRQNGFSESASQELGLMYASIYTSCALQTIQRTVLTWGADDLLAKVNEIILGQLSIGHPELLNGQKLDPGDAARTLVALAMSVMMEKAKDTEFSDPRYLAGGVLAELWKFLISAKWTRDQIMQCVETTWGIMNSPGTSWAGQAKN